MKKHLFCLAALFVLFACLVVNMTSCVGWLMGGQLVYTNGHKYRMFMKVEYNENGHKYKYMSRENSRNTGDSKGAEEIWPADDQIGECGHLSGLGVHRYIETASSDPEQIITWTRWTSYREIREDYWFDGCDRIDKWELDQIILRLIVKSDSAPTLDLRSLPLEFEDNQSVSLWDLVDTNDEYDIEKAESAPVYEYGKMMLYPRAFPYYVFYTWNRIITAEDGTLYMCPEMEIWIDDVLQKHHYYKIKDEYQDFFQHPVFPDMPEDVYAELFPEQSTEPTEDPATAPATPAP